MQLHLRSLGQIKQATLDIKPLTVFIGPNGTNKSWAAYALYGLAKQISNTPRFTNTHLRQLARQGSRNLRGTIDAVISSVLDTLQNVGPTAIFETSISRKELVSNIPKSIKLRFNSKDLARLMATTQEVFSESSVELELSKDEILARGNTLDENLTISSHEKYIETSTEYEAHRFPKSLPAGVRTSESFLKDSLESALLRFAFSIIGRVVPLPAERKALILFYKFLFARQSGLLQRMLTDLPPMDDKSREAMATFIQRSFFQEMRLALPQPVIDFATLLTQAETTVEYSNDLVRSKFFTNIVHILDDEILGGSIGFNTDDLGRNKIYYSIGKKNGGLDIHVTSSLVRALTGLDVYLNYFAQPGDLLFIDEPEMNAHPEAQLRITEILSSLVNMGIHIVITTHSPYIVDHINNLIEASKVEPDKQDQLSPLFKLRTKEAFLTPDKVALYVFTGQGEVKNIFGRQDASMDLSTFNSASDYLNNLYARILEFGKQE